MLRWQPPRLPPAPIGADPALGFDLVQGRKKNASASGVTVGGVAGAAAQAQLQAAEKKDNTHAAFYRFQQRDTRRSGECLRPRGSCAWDVVLASLLCSVGSIWPPAG